MASSIQLLRSSTPQERPLSGNLLDGQPALNTNAQEPGLFFKATDNSLVKVGPVAITSDGFPPNSSFAGLSGNSVGETWLDKSVTPPAFKIYDGSSWQVVSQITDIPDNYITNAKVNVNAGIDSNKLSYGPRTVENKLGDTRSIKDFGNAGTGGDDSAIFTVALASLSAGEALYLPAGTYVVSQSVTCQRLNLIGNGATIQGFNGTGFIVNQEINLDGTLTFQGFEDDSNREDQKNNFSATAIRIETGSNLNHIRIGKGIKFYRCRCGLRALSQINDITPDVTIRIRGKSWIYSSAEQCCAPILIACRYSDIEVAHGLYKDIIGAGRVVSGVNIFLDGPSGNPFFDQCTRLHFHHLIFDTVIQRTTTGTSLPGNTYECHGLIASARDIQIDHIIGKDVTGVALDCELIYIKAQNFSITSVNAVNCGTQEATINVKGKDPTSPETTPVGGTGHLDDITIQFDRYQYDNAGTTVNLTCSGINIAVPYRVTTGNNVQIIGANGSAVILNGNDAENSDFSGSFKVIDSKGDNALSLRGSFVRCKAKVESRGFSGSGNFFYAIRMSEVAGRGTLGDYDFSGSSIYFNNNKSMSQVGLLRLTYSSADITSLRINDCLCDIVAPNASEIFGLSYSSSAGSLTGSWDYFEMKDWSFIRPFPPNSKVIRRGNYKPKSWSIDLSYKYSTNNNTTYTPIDFFLLPGTQASFDFESKCMRQDVLGQMKWTRLLAAFYENSSVATPIPSSTATLINLGNGSGVASIGTAAEVVSTRIQGSSGQSCEWICALKSEASNSTL